MKNVKITLPFYLSVLIGLSICFLMFNGCSDDDATGPQTDQVSSITIHPEAAEIAEGEQLDFSVVLLSATGETLDPDDFDIEWQWWSTDTDVFTVEPGGLATGENPGEAYCMIEAVVAVSQKTKEIPDRLVVQAGFLPMDHNIGSKKTINLSLTATDRKIPAFDNVNVSLTKEMRFTGRDSAFVVVF